MVWQLLSGHLCRIALFWRAAPCPRAVLGLMLCAFGLGAYGETLTASQAYKDGCYEQKAMAWHYGWMGFHGVAAVGQGLEAWRTSGKATRRVNEVGAVTEIIAMGDLLLNPLYPLGEQLDDEQKLALLSERVQERTSWTAHMLGWFVSLAGGLIVAGGPGKRSDAVEFFVISGLVAEAEIWTLPRSVVDVQKEHQTRLSRAASLKPVSVSAIPHGIQLHWLF